MTTRGMVTLVPSDNTANATNELNVMASQANGIVKAVTEIFNMEGKEMYEDLYRFLLLFVPALFRQFNDNDTLLAAVEKNMERFYGVLENAFYSQPKQMQSFFTGLINTINTVVESPETRDFLTKVITQLLISFHPSTVHEGFDTNVTNFFTELFENDFIPESIPEYVEYDDIQDWLSNIQLYAVSALSNDANMSASTAEQMVESINLMQARLMIGEVADNDEVLPALGYPGIVCTVRKFECRDPEDMKSMRHFMELEKTQAGYFNLRPLPINNTCHFNPNTDDAVYIATNDDAGILCGSMAIRFFHRNRAVEINLFATQREKNPNIQGVGRDIMNRLLADCAASNVSFIFLFPLEGAIPFYEKFGFRFFKTGNFSLDSFMYLPVSLEPTDITSVSALKPE